MKLSELAKSTLFKPDQQKYLLGMIGEVAGLTFVEQLCQVAYDLGFDDAVADAFDGVTDISLPCEGKE